MMRRDARDLRGMNTADILVIGGGVISLAIALELRLQGASVTILCRDPAQAATQAAAGMLAPQAEQIPPSPLLELCLQSRSLYPDWIDKLATLTGLPTGYWACGILAPSYDLPPATRLMDWRDRPTLLHQQPGLSAEVMGGYWFPQDAQVDNRALAKALWVAGQDLGVTIQTGVTVEAIAQHHDRVTHLQTTQGNWQADHYILATGAWSQDLLPIPVWPQKGQLVAVQVPGEIRTTADLPLQTVLFGSEIYIVPRQDGRIILGATVETVGFTGGNTPAGIQQLLAAALRLYPPLQNFPLQECWWGFRPATPDQSPLLGPSPYPNLTLATGHHRNGILLAPITAKLIANWVLHQQSDPLLQHFHWSRLVGAKA
jgi:glycine oxidase